MKSFNSTLLLSYCFLSSLAIVYLLFENESRVSTDGQVLSNLTLVDSAGQRRIVIGPQLPKPYLDGKEYEREIDPSGMVFYDLHGNECGGIATNHFKDVETNVLAFDYDRSEALFLFKSETENKRDYHAGLAVLDKPAPGLDPREIQTVRRILLENDNGNSSLVLHDREGNPRIVLTVDTLDSARILIKNKSGKVVNALK